MDVSHQISLTMQDNTIMFAKQNRLLLQPRVIQINP
jgi:hypothetical protein